MIYKHNRFSLYSFLIIALVVSTVFLVHSVFNQNCFYEQPEALITADVLTELDQIIKGPVGLAMDNRELIKKINKDFLQPPSRLPYKLANPANENPSMGQSNKILELMKHQSKGFFIECGALDGETRSNTLIFEKKFGWQGLLVEADPKNYALLMDKNRHAWSTNVCLSTKPYPQQVMFKQQFNVGKISDMKMDETRANGHIAVQCLPIYSLMLALNVTTVEYFSLDVEGAELEILKTIPWEKVNIKTLSVEFIHGQEGKDSLKSYMESQGYAVYAEVTNPGWLANDFIFVRKEILTSMNETKL